MDAIASSVGPRTKLRCQHIFHHCFVYSWTEMSCLQLKVVGPQILHIFAQFFSSLVNSMIDGLCKDVSETKQYFIQKGVRFLSYIGIIRHPKKHILPPSRFRDVYYRFCVEKIYTIAQNSFEIPLRIWFVKCVSN